MDYRGLHLQVLKDTYEKFGEDLCPGDKRVFKMLYSLTSPVVFISMVLDGLVLVLIETWMVISLANSDLMETGKMLFAFTGNLISIIVVCFPSQLMSNASYDFFLQSNCLKWYNYPIKAKKLLILIMAKSMQPLVLSAGPTIELNFDTCSTVIKGTFSYATTFRSIYTSWENL